MPNGSPNSWDGFWAALGDLRARIDRTKTVHVNSVEILEMTKQVVQDYFRRLRPELAYLDLNLETSDSLLQELLRLSNGRNLRKSYLAVIRELQRVRNELEGQREVRLGERAMMETRPQSTIQPTDRQIIETLRKLLPSAALGYQQAILDLSNGTRLSYRGTATELRETLREVVNHLAPDEVTMKSPGFKLEKDRSGPTMKQKVRFILQTRGQPKNAMKAPEDAASIVEEFRAAFARSTYERGSISTHTVTTRQEILQLKRYVDTALCELLEIH